MKFVKVFGFVLLSLLLFGCSATRPLSMPESGPAVEFTPPAPEEWVLDNGLRVLFLHDTELPISSGRVYIKGGNLWTEKENNDLIGIMGGQMRAGGAGGLSPEDLDRKLELLAASVESSFGSEFGSVSFHCLSEDIDQVFPIFADVLLRPRFDQGKLAISKGQILESIRRRKDDPGTIARISFRELVYGDNVYGSPLTSDRASRLDRSRLQQLHNKFVRPDGGILILTGDIDKERFKALANKYLGGWKARGSEFGEPPVNNNLPQPGIYFIEGDFKQSNILLGHLGPRRLSEDHYSIEMFNDIVGGSGLTGRLTEAIRVEKGLAYSVYGGVYPGVEKGAAAFVVQTKGESTAEAIEEILRVLKQIRKEPPGQDELSRIRDGIVNRFVFSFAEPAVILRRRASLSLMGYPENYDKEYLQKIRAVTAEEISQVAQNRVDLNGFVIVVVGDQTAYNSLKTLKNSEVQELQSLKVERVKFTEKLVRG